MRLITLLHRWAGGLLGLLLATFGLTGTLLLHKETWLRWILPHADDPPARGVAELSEAITMLLADRARRPSAIVLASDDFGMDRLVYAGSDAGAYADQAGHVLLRWSSIWERPEIWLFDLHRHLLNGDSGEAVGGAVALLGIAFVITGALLWWRTRRTFNFRPWPKRLSRPAVVRHHRDLGIVVAPLLLVSFITGAMIALRPIEAFVLRPLSSSAELASLRRPPDGKWGALARDFDWRAVLATVRLRFPQATVRVIGLPTKSGAPIPIRVRQPSEWVPNGSTILWFDPATARLIGVRDALALPAGLRLATAEYPVHAAKVGGLIWRLALTVSGLALTLLGTLAVFTFWRGRRFRSAKRHTPASPLASRKPISAPRA